MKKGRRRARAGRRSSARGRRGRYRACACTRRAGRGRTRWTGRRRGRRSWWGVCATWLVLWGVGKGTELGARPRTSFAFSPPLGPRPRLSDLGHAVIRGLLRSAGQAARLISILDHLGCGGLESDHHPLLDIDPPPNWLSIAPRTIMLSSPSHPRRHPRI